MQILKKIPNWRSFKVLGSSKLIKSSYWWLFIVPTIAKILETTDDTVTIKIFGTILELTLKLPFSWSLFYLSSVFFALASLLYLIYSPHGINNYDNFEDWKKDGKHSTSLIRAYLYMYRSDKEMYPFEITETAKNYFLTHMLEYGGHTSQVNKTNNTPIALLKHVIPKENEKLVFDKLMDITNVSQSKVRLVLTFLYGLGFIFFSIILIQNFMYVLKHM